MNSAIAKVDSQRLIEPVWVGNLQTNRQVLMRTDPQTREITLSKSDGELLARYPAETTKAQIVKDMGAKGSELFGQGEVLYPKNEGFVSSGWVGSHETKRQLEYGTNSNGLVTVRNEKGETLATYKEGTTKEKIRAEMNDPKSRLYNKGPALPTTLSDTEKQSSILAVQSSNNPSPPITNNNPSPQITNGASDLSGTKPATNEPPDKKTKPATNEPPDIKISGALTIQYSTNQTTGAKEIRFVGTGSAKIPFDGGSVEVTAGAVLRQTISRAGKTDWILEPQVGANLTIKTGAGVVAINSSARLNMSTGQVVLNAGGSLKLENGVTISGRLQYNFQTGIVTELGTGVSFEINKGLDGVIRILRAQNATSGTTVLEAGVTAKLGSVEITAAAGVDMATGAVGLNGAAKFRVSKTIDLNFEFGKFPDSQDNTIRSNINFRF